MNTILIVGASGAQGAAITQHLSTTGRYQILALTRSAESSEAKALAALPNVRLVINNASNGYDTIAFLKAASEADYVYVNTDGFAMGEQSETYWGIRLFELSVRAGVKHLIYSGLDYNGKKSGYDPKYYVGHYEGKAKVQEWMHAQKDIKMKWSIIRSGPYLSMMDQIFVPTKNSDGVSVFYLPLGDGAMPLIHLNDFAKYVDWALSNPQESEGKDFGIARAHVTGNDIANAFATHTGKPAKFVDIPIEQWNAAAWTNLPNGQDTKVGYHTHKDTSTLLMSYGQNFENWWNLYKASADNKGLIQRDYEFLDRIVPDRLRSVLEWMELTKYTGEKKNILKTKN